MNDGLFTTEILRLKKRVAELEGNSLRLQHIINVLRTVIGTAWMSAESIEENTRVADGRVEVFFLGEWVDIVQERQRTDAIMAGEEAAQAAGGE